MQNFVLFDHVCKTYRMGDVCIDALKDASFTIAEGEICVIVGQSGAGKTTLLNILGGMDRLTSGHVLLAGEDVSGFDRRQLTAYRRHEVGFVFQFYNLLPNMTALENVQIAGQLCKNPIPADEVLRQVGLGERMQNFPAQLSGGEQQRVALARALVTKPNILLLDEPLSALDRKVRAEMQYEIRNLQRQIGTTTVFVTHDQEEALTMSDQIILLHDGQIEQQGDPFTIYSQPASVFASDFLGKANLLSGVLACEDGVWCVCSENVRIPVNHVGGREGDTVKTAVRGEYFEFCTPETEGANPFHLEKKIFTGLSWKLIGTLGTQPLDISALGTHAGTLSEGDDLFVRIRPENVVYYNNN